MLKQRCPDCGGDVYWTLTKNNRRMPVDADVSERGNIRLAQEATGIIRATVYAEPVTGGHLCHLVTCPNYRPTPERSHRVKSTQTVLESPRPASLERTSCP